MGGLCVFPCADGDPWPHFKKGWEMCPSATLAQGPSPAWKNPRLMPGSTGVPLGLGLGWGQRPGHSPKESTCWGPFEKQDVGGGPRRPPHPQPPPAPGKVAPCPLPPAPSHGDSGTHLISPGMVPALSSWPLPGQATSPAWKKTHQTRPVCLWGVESSRRGGLGWGGVWSSCSP